MLAVSGADKLSFTPGLDAVALHELSYSLFAYTDASDQEFFPHLGPAVFLLDLSMDGLDVHQQGFVADELVATGLTGLGAIFAAPMFKVAAGADSQHLAVQADGPHRLMFGNSRVLHSDHLGKYAAAFPRMLRSRFTLDNSARSRASSICSGDTGSSPAPLS